MIVDLVYKQGWKPSLLRPVVCGVLSRRANTRGNWGEFPNIDGEVRDLIDNAPWYKVYDLIETLYQQMAASPLEDRQLCFEDDVNDYFIERGIGWKLSNGEVQYRGPEGFDLAVSAAQKTVWDAGLPTAAEELNRAIKDLSRRPEPDHTGAVQHAMAALECVARHFGESKDTLGDLVRRNPDLMPKPLDQVVVKLWGFTSECGRHLREGLAPLAEEAEFVVGASAILASYLTKLHAKV